MKDEDNTKNTRRNTFLTSTQIFIGICEPFAIKTIEAANMRSSCMAQCAAGCLAPVEQHAPRVLSWVSSDDAQPEQTSEPVS
jgi:hypothetical protein